MTTKEPDLPDDVNQQNDADRGIPLVSKKAKGGVGQKLIVAGLALFTVLALCAVNGVFSKKDPGRQISVDDKKSKENAVGNLLGPSPSLPAPPAPPAPRVEEAKPQGDGMLRTGQVAPPPVPPQSYSRGTDQNAPPTPEERKKGSSLLAFNDNANNGGGSNGASMQGMPQQGGLMPGQAENSPDRADGIDNALKSSKLDGARASLIVDRNMFITRGTFLDCALETAISSDVPGMTSCRITRDIYSTSGKVLLLERGSRITGQYQGGLQRGKARIFVLWTRVETPNGVIVEIDSPGTDPLGRSGHDGYIDNHFWQRFGGAMLLSFVDDIGTYAGNKINENSQVSLSSTTDTSKDAASIALENSINIPPTLYKNQGEHINVFVARDLDFRGVYDLKAN